MATGEDALRVLQSIDATLKELLALSRRRVTAAKGTAVATDRDLDSKYGDPELKFMPRDWTGDSFKGARFSQCPAELLEMVAETFDYFAAQADAKNETTDRGKPVADYKRQDAARARGWAKRNRAGGAPSTNGHTPEWADGGY